MTRDSKRRRNNNADDNRNCFRTIFIFSLVPYCFHINFHSYLSLIFYIAQLFIFLFIPLNVKNNKKNLILKREYKNFNIQGKKGFFMPACCRSHKGLIMKTIKDKDFSRKCAQKESEKVSTFLG